MEGEKRGWGGDEWSCFTCTLPLLAPSRRPGVAGSPGVAGLLDDQNGDVVEILKLLKKCRANSLINCGQNTGSDILAVTLNCIFDGYFVEKLCLSRVNQTEMFSTCINAKRSQIALV
jgi:hypothetical protein